MAPPLTYEQAALLVNLTVRRLQQIVREGSGPRCVDARFPVADFADWLAARNTESNFQAERTRLTRAQADKTELEVAELAGDLCRTNEVTTAWGDKNASARAKFLGFPAKIAQRIAPPERIAEVQKLAQECVYEVLLELAGDGLPERTRARRANGGRDLGATAGPDGQRVGRPESAAVARVKRRAGKVVDGDG